MSRHERGYRMTCVCSDCDGRKTIPIDDGEIDCPECRGSGEVYVPPLSEEEADRMFEYADRARRLVGGEGW